MSFSIQRTGNLTHPSAADGSTATARAASSASASTATGRRGGASATASASASASAAATFGANAGRGAGDAAAGTHDSAMASPKVPRFPWLSRLSQQLESAARSKPAFQSAPVIGDNVDKKV